MAYGIKSLVPGYRIWVYTTHGRCGKRDSSTAGAIKIIREGCSI